MTALPGMETPHVHPHHRPRQRCRRRQRGANRRRDAARGRSSGRPQPGRNFQGASQPGRHPRCRGRPKPDRHRPQDLSCARSRHSREHRRGRDAEKCVLQGSGRAPLPPGSPRIHHDPIHHSVSRGLLPARSKQDRSHFGNSRAGIERADAPCGVSARRRNRCGSAVHRHCSRGPAHHGARLGNHGASLRRHGPAQPTGDSAAATPSSRRPRHGRCRLPRLVHSREPPAAVAAEPAGQVAAWAVAVRCGRPRRHRPHRSNPALSGSRRESGPAIFGPRLPRHRSVSVGTA